jgi:hypothetical protein
MIFPLIAFNVSANEPPSLPEINGPTRAREGEVLTYTFVSIDPEEDDISYCIQWGDDNPEICIGPFKSGEEQLNTHSYDNGEYTIKIKARDINGAESNWAYLEIKIPKNNLINHLIMKFQYFPKLFQLFQNFLIF